MHFSTKSDNPPNAARPVRWQNRNYAREFERLRTARFIVISFPKSGRTWHRVMLGLYLAKSCGRPERDAFDLEGLCAAANIGRIDYSHNGANFDDGLLPTHNLFAAPVLWENRTILLIVRNPKDLLVSAYHHARFRNFTFAGSLSEFVRDPRTGISKIMAALTRWQANQSLASSFDVVSYEAMHQTPEQVLRNTLLRAGISRIDDALIRETVELCQFERMQEYERTNYFQTNRLNNPSNEPRASKVREGRVGGFSDYLSPADEAFIEDHVLSVGNPFNTLAAAAD
jgi:hypothetical protein